MRTIAPRSAAPTAPPIAALRALWVDVVGGGDGGAGVGGAGVGVLFGVGGGVGCFGRGVGAGVGCLGGTHILSHCALFIVPAASSVHWPFPGLHLYLVGAGFGVGGIGVGCGVGGSVGGGGVGWAGVGGGGVGGAVFVHVPLHFLCVSAPPGITLAHLPVELLQT